MMEIGLAVASIAQIVVLPLFPSEIYKKYLSFLCGLIQVTVLALISFRCFHLTGTIVNVLYVSCVALLFGSSSVSTSTRYGLMTALATIGILSSSSSTTTTTSATNSALNSVSSSVNVSTLLLVVMPYDYLHLSKYELIVLSSALFACIDDCMRLLHLTPGAETEAGAGAGVSRLGEVLGLVEIAVLTCVVYGVICYYLYGGVMERAFQQQSKALRLGVTAAVIMGVFGVGSALMAQLLQGRNPLVWLIVFLGEQSSFQYAAVCLVWIVMIVVAVPLIRLLSITFIGSKVISRKLFHTLAIAMFVPAITYYTEFALLAFGGGLCGLVLAEYVRNAPTVLPELSRRISGYYGTFIDHRDVSRGLVLTHIYLLLGIALPVWLWAVLVGKQEGWFDAVVVGTTGTTGSIDFAPSDPHLKLLKHLGWITVGAGDAMGAFVGVHCGRTSWPSRSPTGTGTGSGSGRTVEGSLGCFVTMLTCAAGVAYAEGLWGGQQQDQQQQQQQLLLLSQLSQDHQVHTGLSPYWWPVVVISLMLTTLVEAYTIDIDNLVLPVFSCGIYLVLLQLVVVPFPFPCS